MNKNQMKLMVQVAMQSYSTHAWFSAAEWLEAKRLLREDDDFRAYYERVTRSGQ